MPTLKRPELEKQLALHLKNNPVVSILGPRQCGKSTLARRFIQGLKNVTFFDLELESDRRQLEQPQQALESLRGLVVIDEIQRLPKLYELLRVLTDRSPLLCRFLILGSVSPWLIKGISESLAGRVSFLDMSGFGLNEIGTAKLHTLWLRGGFPRSTLARDDAQSFAWRENFIRTFLERDLPVFGSKVSSTTMRRLWMMLAHNHGQIFNSSKLGSSLDLNYNTVRSHVDFLDGAFVLRRLQPWFTNIKKRQVKSPKIYIRDTGLLHTLLGIQNRRELLSHPTLGTSWESFALEEVLKKTGDRHAWFWSTHQGAELDLLIQAKGENWGFEFKYSDAPTVTKSMRIAIDNLNLKKLWIIHPGKRSYRIEKKIEALPLADLAKIKLS